MLKKVIDGRDLISYQDLNHETGCLLIVANCHNNYFFIHNTTSEYKYCYYGLIINKKNIQFIPYREMFYDRREIRQIIWGHMEDKDPIYYFEEIDELYKYILSRKK